MSALNARTTVFARKVMVQRHRAGSPQARIAEQLGVSRPTVRASGQLRFHRMRSCVTQQD